MPRVLICYYSMYGHIYELAKTMKDGLEANGVEVKMVQVPETLPDEVLAKMHAPKKQPVPVATVADLEEADGIMWGVPTRFGMPAAQMKTFMDSTGGLWKDQKLAGKPAGIFFSTASQNGGQETTALTMITQLVHHGMIYVPLGYASPLQFSMDTPEGGSPYGAGCLAGPDGSRKVSEIEKGKATKQAELFAGIVKKMAA